MYAQCAALLTATVLMTTAPLAADRVAATNPSAVHQVLAADAIATGPARWAAYYGDDEDDDGGGDDPREYDRREYPSRRYDQGWPIPREYGRPDPRGYDPRGYDQREYPSRRYDQGWPVPREYGRPDPRGDVGRDPRTFERMEPTYDRPAPTGPDSRGGNGRPADEPRVTVPRRVAPPPAVDRPARPDARIGTVDRPRVDKPDEYELSPVAPPRDGLVHITVFRAGQYMEVTNVEGRRFHWPISTGKDGYLTEPIGETRIQADRGDVDHHSKEFDGAPMPFAMWWNRARGLAIHGTDMNAALGRTDSHGCIRLSRANAETVFWWVNRAGGAILDIR